MKISSGDTSRYKNVDLDSIEIISITPWEEVELPKTASPILGFRRWGIDRESVFPKLFSVAVNDFWQPGINTAACHRGRGHSAPEKLGYCDCGFNAWYTLDDADIHYRSSESVLGAVAGAGEVSLHKGGWRASEAQILALYGKKDDYHLQTIAEHYGIPVIEDRNEFLKLVQRLVPNNSANLDKLSDHFLEQEKPVQVGPAIREPGTIELRTLGYGFLGLCFVLAALLIFLLL